MKLSKKPARQAGSSINSVQSVDTSYLWGWVNQGNENRGWKLHHKLSDIISKIRKKKYFFSILKIHLYRREWERDYIYHLYLSVLDLSLDNFGKQNFKLFEKYNINYYHHYFPIVIHYTVIDSRAWWFSLVSSSQHLKTLNINAGYFYL